MFFLLALVFTAWLAFERLKSSKQDEERVRAFWQRENDANNTRRKNLDTLTYIKVPNWITLDALSSALPTDDAELNRCSDIFKSLSSQRILNLTGMTSTDIKMEYGPANLNKLDEYDQNFTLFAQTIYAYGERLHTLGFDHEAMRVLRFGIDSLSDISGNYKLLASLYIKYGQQEKISEIRDTATKLNSLLKKSIIKYLDELTGTTSTTPQN
ncbi:MAG: hypothetical protein IJD58_03100 [Lachnospiraceae bacterium]|nr:hypothetical protein [Lachnospiraceae bacterium]